MSLSEYILVSDPFRYATQHLDPLPCRMELLPPTHDLAVDRPKIVRIVQDVLRAAQTSYDQCFLLEYQPMALGTYPPKPLVRILSQELDTTLWRAAIGAVKRVLEENKFGQVAVEILHPVHAHELVLYPITGQELDGLVTSKWAQCKGRVIEILNAYLRNEEARWASVGVFMTGPPAELKPTIVVKVDGPWFCRAMADWAHIEEMIMSLIRDDPKDNRVSVEFSYGNIVPSNYSDT